MLLSLYLWKNNCKVKELSVLQIEMIDKILEIINQKDRDIRKSFLDTQMQHEFGQRFDSYQAYSIYYHTVLNSILIKQYRLVDIDNANICLTRKGRIVAKSDKGIEGYIEELTTNDKYVKLSAKLAIWDSLATIISALLSIATFVLAFISPKMDIFYPILAIAGFLMGFISRDLLKYLRQYLMKRRISKSLDKE